MKKYLVGIGLILVAVAAWVFVTLRKISAPAPVFRRPAKGNPRQGLSNRVIQSGGVARGYWLYVPSGYQPGTPVPLVLNLHGFASSAWGQRFFSRWDKLAEK